MVPERYFCRSCHMGYDGPVAGGPCPRCGFPVVVDLETLGEAVALRPSVIGRDPAVVRQLAGTARALGEEVSCATCGLTALPIVQDRALCCSICQRPLHEQVARDGAGELEHARVFVSADASWAEGLAGLAYESAAIGCDQRAVKCSSSTAAELLALLMAMDAARGREKVTFRVDCASAAAPHQERGEPDLVVAELRPLRQRAASRLSREGGWVLVRIPRGHNARADALARQARRQALQTPREAVGVARAGMPLAGNERRSADRRPAGPLTRQPCVAGVERSGQ